MDNIIKFGSEIEDVTLLEEMEEEQYSFKCSICNKKPHYISPYFEDKYVLCEICFKNCSI